LKKNKKSSHKLPKQQSTSFWSQGILGVNYLFVKLTILYSIQLNVSHIQKLYQNDIN
jgi:hypothetical protein